jgi:hypothetical protein
MADMFRTSLFLPLAAVAVLALSACGSSGKNNNNSSSADDKAYAGALKFSKCMREHGVDVPDPQRGTNGGILMKSGGPGKGGPSEKGLSGPGNPKFEAAEKECGKYMVRGGGKAPSPAEQAKRNDAFIGYAGCMRGKGINFPDPKITANGVQMMLGKGVRPDSAKFKAADKACHPLLSAVEPKDAQSQAPAGASVAP